MTDADRRFFLSIASMAAGEHGKLVHARIRETGKPLSAEDIDAARAYAERVWHGLERAPIRPIDAERFGQPPSDAGGSRDS
jgi:hypothetical protein